MLLQWQPVLGRGTTKTATQPLEKQLESQRLNMLHVQNSEFLCLYFWGNLTLGTAWFTIEMWLLIPAWLQVGKSSAWFSKNLIFFVVWVIFLP